MPKSKHVLGIPDRRHIFGTVKVGEKGQIVIPKEARDLYGISPGDTLLILGDDSCGIIITPPEHVRDAAKRIFSKIDKVNEDRDHGN